MPWTWTMGLLDAKADDTSPLATNAEGKYICQVSGILPLRQGGRFHHSCWPQTILVDLSLLAAAQSKPTTHTFSLVKWLLDYATTNPLLSKERSKD